MRMDIACPAELLHFEQADFGGARRQAYLTFLNESPHRITALSGLLELIDQEGRAFDERRIAFGDINTPSGGRFTCHLPLDDYPSFATAEMIVEDVLFDEEEPWALHPTRLKDYEPDRVPEGPERNALVAIAGEDAVCYPSRDGTVWVCVCGRFNRWRWPVCRRCGRERDVVLETFTPENIAAAHRRKVEKARQQPPRVLVDNTQRSRKRKQSQIPKKQGASLNLLGILRSKWFKIAVGVILAGLLVWAAVSIAGRIPHEEPNMYRHDISPDYLEPVS